MTVKLRECEIYLNDSIFSQKEQAQIIGILEDLCRNPEYRELALGEDEVTDVSPVN